MEVLNVTLDNFEEEVLKSDVPVLVAGEYQADERAGVARLSWRVSGR